MNVVITFVNGNSNEYKNVAKVSMTNSAIWLAYKEKGINTELGIPKSEVLNVIVKEKEE
jgi:hypothetical protein